MSIATRLRRHPLVGYVAIAFGLSWGGVAAVMATEGFSMAPMQSPEAVLLFALMLLGPSVGGIVLTGLLDGQTGLRALAARLTRWKVSPYWYAVALFTAPVALLVVLFGLAGFDPVFAPRFQWTLLGVGLVAGAFEEIGWTGFATPRLLASGSVLSAGLALGVVWAFWHALVDFRHGGTATGSAWIIAFAFTYVVTLVPYRILMTALFQRTGSGLLGILMHASYTGSLLALLGIMPWHKGLLWQGLFASVLWGLVALTLLVERRTRVRLGKHRAISSPNRPANNPAFVLTAVRGLHTLIYVVMAASTLVLLAVAITGRFGGALWVVGPMLTAEVLIFLLFGLKCPLTAVVDRFAGIGVHVADTYLPETLTRHTLAIFGPILPLAVMLLAARWAGVIAEGAGR